MRIKGKIMQWDDAKGFGFIQPILKGERVFVHIKALQNRTRRPVLGEVVTYNLSKDEQGRLQAQDVTFAGEKYRIRTAKTASKAPLLLVLGFAGGGFWPVVDLSRTDGGRERQRAGLERGYSANEP